MSGWAFAAAANSGAGSNWRVSCSSADSALSWVAGSVTASSLGRQSQMAETRRLGAELVYVRNSSTCGNSSVAETRASGWLRGANGKLSSLACRATGDVRRERQGAESQRPRRPRAGRRGLWAPLAMGVSAGAGDHLIGMTGSTTRFQVALITPAADAYQARKAVTMPR